jgi:hypothetical protein
MSELQMLQNEIEMHEGFSTSDGQVVRFKRWFTAPIGDQRGTDVELVPVFDNGKYLKLRVFPGDLQNSDYRSNVFRRIEEWIQAGCPKVAASCRC